MRQYKLKSEIEYYNGKFTELDWAIVELDKYICDMYTNQDYRGLIWTFRSRLYERRSQIAEMRSDLKHSLRRAK